MVDGVRGSQGYAEQSAELLIRYESVRFEETHAPALDLLPPAPAPVLDIGSGTGRDAAYFADRGHRVVAVEPTDTFRRLASQRHPSPAIDWVDDALPHLRHVVARDETFALVMLTAVWMHLDEAERRAGMPVLGSLVRPGGKLIMSLRHGPVPAGRCMFPVTAAETIALAGAEGLRPVLNRESESLQEHNRRAGVTWTRLGFEKPA